MGKCTPPTPHFFVGVHFPIIFILLEKSLDKSFWEGNVRPPPPTFLGVHPINLFFSNLPPDAREREKMMIEDSLHFTLLGAFHWIYLLFYRFSDELHSTFSIFLAASLFGLILQERFCYILCSINLDFDGDSLFGLSSVQVLLTWVKSPPILLKLSPSHYRLLQRQIGFILANNGCATGITFCVADPTTWSP